MMRDQRMVPGRVMEGARMGRGTTGLLLLSACLGLPAGVRADDPARLLLPPAPVKSSTVARPASPDEPGDLPPARGGAYADRLPPDPKIEFLSGGREPPEGSTARGADAPRSGEPPVRPRAAGLARPEGERTVPAHLVEATDRRRTSGRDRDGIDDFLDRRSDLGRPPADDRRRGRAAGKFGDKLGGLFDRDEGRRGWFCSDHGFDQFVSPITNPFLFEDPRALTEVRPVFIYQKIPSPQPNFQGGNLWFVGARGSVAVTERVSLTVHKVGAVGVYPGGASPLDSDFGFAEVWLGPKVTLIRDPEFGTILSGGAVFQVPTGAATVYQDTGSLSIAPYLSAGQTLLRTRLGSVNGMATAGYSFSTTRARSEYVYASGHLDYDVGDFHRFYPVAELNWFQYTTDGTARAIAGEGRDLINFGGPAKGSNLLTGAAGARFKLSEAAQVGAAFELPLVGNRDLFRYRFTVDFIWRY